MPGRRLYRSTTDKKICGVCGGLAAYLDTDPVIIRLVAVGMIFIGGPVTLMLYFIACIVVPNQPAMAAPMEPAPASSQGGYVPPEGAPGAGAAPESAPQSFVNPSSAPAAGDRAGGSRGTLIGGLILFWLGILFLCLNLGVFDWGIFHWWRWRIIWPLILITLGGWILWRSIRNEREGTGRQGA